MFEDNSHCSAFEILELYPNALDLHKRMTNAYQEGKFISFMNALLKYPLYHPAFIIISEAIYIINLKTINKEIIKSEQFLWIAIAIEHNKNPLT